MEVIPVGGALRSFVTKVLADRFRTGALLLGVGLLVLGIALARYGSSHNVPAARAGEPSAGSAPSPTPAVLPTPSEAKPLPRQPTADQPASPASSPQIARNPLRPAASAEPAEPSPAARSNTASAHASGPARQTAVHPAGQLTAGSSPVGQPTPAAPLQYEQSEPTAGYADQERTSRSVPSRLDGMPRAATSAAMPLAGQDAVGHPAQESSHGFSQQSSHGFSQPEAPDFAELAGSDQPGSLLEQPASPFAAPVGLAPSSASLADTASTGSGTTDMSSSPPPFSAQLPEVAEPTLAAGPPTNSVAVPVERPSNTRAAQPMEAMQPNAAVPDATTSSPPGVFTTAPAASPLPTLAQPSVASSSAGSANPQTVTAPSPFDVLPPPGAGKSPAMVPPPATHLPQSSSDGFTPQQSQAQPPPAESVNASGGVVSGIEGDARPGDPSLEGPQSPQVTIQKVLPAEIQVGKPATFRIVVRNSGAIPVPKVEVRDPVPWGVRVLQTNPTASQSSQGMLVWTLGPLNPGDEVKLEAEVMPLQEGELGSVATLVVHTQASAKAQCTRPQLTVKTEFPPQTMLGEEIQATMTISNTGSGVATNVVLEEHVPPELLHPAGNELENVLGDLKPGESRQIRLRLQAVRAGNAVNRLIARADANLRVEDQTTIQVLAPQLELAIDGPNKRFLDRETVYRISLSNKGTAPAKNVQLQASLPAGLQFVRANNSGSYDPTTHSVQWLLAELPVGQTGAAELVVKPIAAGSNELVCAVRDDLGVSAEQRLAIQVEGISALHFQVADTKDPLPVGSETIYEIRVINQGTKEATNVQVVATLPQGLRALAGEGPVANTVNGNEVLFGKLPQLAPKAEAVFRIRAQAVAAGDQRARVQILSDDIRLPITKEESTQVYADSPE